MLLDAIFGSYTVQLYEIVGHLITERRSMSSAPSSFILQESGLHHVV